MTDPDQPFRRSQQGHVSGDNRTVVPEQSGTPVIGASDDPLILDPELHQSVWKPWQDERGSSSLTARHTKGKRARTAIIVGALGMVLVLVAAVVVPGLLHTTTWRAQPLVVDMPTTPEIAWSSPLGQPCVNSPDEDQAILTDTRRVWSLDLNNGQTLWSVDLNGHGRITCLPGAELVAVTMLDDGDETILGTKLLSASSGAEVAQLPGSSTTHVIPLGSDIGLVDDTNMLRAVHPGELDSPLWSRQLQGPPGELELIVVEGIDDEVVQVVYYADSGLDEPDEFFTLIVRMADGTSPPWAQGASTGSTDYQRLGDLITHSGDESAGVFDLQGQQLWDLGDDLLGVAGSSLYVSWPSSSDPNTGYTNLHKVAPRTGTKIGGDAFQGWFERTVAVKDNIAVVRGGTLLILDEHLQEQPTISIEGFLSMYEGHKWVYTESSDPGRNGEPGSLLSALDPDDARVPWTLRLDPGQHLGQLGRHLIVVDEDGTLHGLTGRS